MLPNRTPYAPQLIAWLGTLKTRQGIETVNEKHTCTIDSCTKPGKIEVIDSRHNLYGCSNSGKYHVCYRDIDACKNTTDITDDGNVVCVFSGAKFENIWDLFDGTNTEDKSLAKKKEINVDGAKEVIEKWMQMRREVYGFDTVNKRHVCSYQGCVATKYIDVIDEAHRLYGCLISGTYHICQGDEDTCRYTVLTDEGAVVCMFSGIELSIMIDKAQYGKPKTGIEHFDVDAEPTPEEIDIQMQLIATVNDVSIGNNDCEDVAEDTTPHDSTEFQKNVPSLGPCESGVMLDNKSVLITESTTSEWFDSASVRRKKKRKNQNKISNMNNASQAAVAVLMDILYNTNERKRLDTKHIKEMEAAAESVIRKSYKHAKRARVMPVRHEIDAKYDNCMRKKRRIIPLDYDRIAVQKYQLIILKLWEIILQTEYYEHNHSKFHPKQHAIGILYMMQMPFSVENSDGGSELLIAEDAFLYHNLPHENDLKEINSIQMPNWTYNKKDVTIGRNNFKMALLSIKDNEMRSEIFAKIKKIAGLE